MTNYADLWYWLTAWTFLAIAIPVVLILCQVAVLATLTTFERPPQKIRQYISTHVEATGSDLDWHRKQLQSFAVFAFMMLVLPTAWQLKAHEALKAGMVFGFRYPLAPYTALAVAIGWLIWFS